jgi:hypothetical protein
VALANMAMAMQQEANLADGGEYWIVIRPPYIESLGVIFAGIYVGPSEVELVMSVR